MSEIESQTAQWKKCSKQLLDDRQLKHSWRLKNGKLPRPARNTKHLMTSTPSCRGHKEQLGVELDQLTVTVQSRRDARVKTKSKVRVQTDHNNVQTAIETKMGDLSTPVPMVT